MSVPRDYIRSELSSVDRTVVGQLDHLLLFNEHRLEPLCQLFSTCTHSALTSRTKTMSVTVFFFISN